MARFLGCDNISEPDRPQLVALFAHARKTAADLIQRGERLDRWLDHEARNPGAQANAAVLAAPECAPDLVELAAFIVTRFPHRYDMDNFMRYCHTTYHRSHWPAVGGPVRRTNLGPDPDGSRKDTASPSRPPTSNR